MTTTKYPNRWLPGTSGNPNGRPLGARTEFSNSFLRDLAASWGQCGPEVLANYILGRDSRRGGPRQDRLSPRSSLSYPHFRTLLLLAALFSPTRWRHASKRGRCPQVNALRSPTRCLRQHPSSAAQLLSPSRVAPMPTHSSPSIPFLFCLFFPCYTAHHTQKPTPGGLVIDGTQKG
jgi:hypothetical protein